MEAALDMAAAQGQVLLTREGVGTFSACTRSYIKYLYERGDFGRRLAPHFYLRSTRGALVLSSPLSEEEKKDE